MTEKTTDGVENEPQTTQEPQTTAEESYYSEDDDPIIAEMKAAEAELEALAKAKEEDKTDDEPEEPKTNEAAPKQTGDDKGKQGDEDKSEVLTVPKPRFDEILAERNLLRDQIGYMKGLVDAGKGKNTSTEDGQQPPTNNQQGNPVDEIDKAISEAEEKKLELAVKYDEGEISTREWKEAELAIDKSIRELSDKRFDKVREETINQTNEVLHKQKVEDWLDSEALKLQAEHPNVAVIDSYPEAFSKAIWSQIDAQAVQNLANKGYDVKSNSPQVELALMKEKAALADQYTPDRITSLLTGKPVPQNQTGNNSQTTDGQKKPSADAINRGKKIDLANEQPPSISDMGNGTSNGEITEADIANMSDDQIADLLEKAPQLVSRALGTTAI